MNEQPQSSKSTILSEYGIVVKIVLVFVIFMMLLIAPNFILSGLVSEREGLKSAVESEITDKWGHSQTVIGPILSIPYLATSDEGHILSVMPENLQIKVEVVPEKRYRSFYEVVVYNSKIHLEGNFKSLASILKNINTASLDLSKASMNIGLGDMRGIEELVNLNWNGQNFQFDPDLVNSRWANQGISTLLSLDANTDYQFKIDLILKGSDDLFFSPVGKETVVDMASSWPNPSFTGSFLPDDRQVGATGFNASWKVLHLNRPIPQYSNNSNLDLISSAFGVKFILTADHYSKTSRTVKYAALLIGLTFLAFFFVELIFKKRIHPLQYVLVGVTLCIFYSLLLSISEHINFNYAYMGATIMTIGLIVLYMKSVFESLRLALLLGAVLFFLYSFVYVLVQLFDYSLLFGSIGLFVIMAFVMYASRKIDWKSLY